MDIRGNQENRKKLNIRMFTTSILVVLMTIVFIGIILTTHRKIIDVTKLELIPMGWFYASEEMTHSKYLKNEDKKVYILSASHEITDEMRGRTLSFRTDDSFVDVYLAEQPLDVLHSDLGIYESDRIYHFGDIPHFGDSPGTYTHFVFIPDHTAGIITVRVETPYKNKFLNNYDFYIGSQNELLYGFLERDSFVFLSGLLILVFGFVLLFIYGISWAEGTRNKQLYYLGLLSLVFACYTNCPLFVNHFVVQNPEVQYYLNYFSLFLLPLLAIAYFINVVKGLRLYVEYFCFVALILTLSVLHFTNVADYTRTIKVFIISLGVFAVSLIVQITINIRNVRRSDRIALIALLLFMIVNVIVYTFGTTLGNQSFITKMGFMMYVIYALLSGLRQVLQTVYKQGENKQLAELAFTDNLTGVGTRYALERDVKDAALDRIHIVSFDLNNLKYYNDTFGHERGDVLLKCGAECIKRVYGNVYRTGGDEFIVLLQNQTDEVLDQLHEALRKEMDVYNKDEHEVKLEMASGYSGYEEGDDSYEDIMRRADHRMYEEKRAMKER